jgi:hypothetical protein
LPTLLVVGLAAAVAVGYLLKVAFVHGWYLVVLAPLLGGAALGGVLYLMVGWTHCRNRWLAASVGILAGLLAYLSYFEFCLVDGMPPQLAWRVAQRVDLLQMYISLRMQTDVQQEMGRPVKLQKVKKADVSMNRFTFAWELLMLVGFAAGAACSRARRAYCPELRQWLRQETALLLPNAGKGFREALENDRMVEYVEGVGRGSDVKSCWRLTLEYARPKDGSAFDYPIYATLKGPAAAVLAGAFRNLYWQLHGMLLRQVKLETVEVLALRPLFPQLAQLLALKHEELRSLPANVAAIPSPAIATSERAEITPIPAPYRQQVRSKGYALWVNLYGATPLVYFFGGGGLLAWGVSLIAKGSMPLGCAAAAIGGVGLLWGGYVGLYCLGVAEDRWIERRLRREVAQRPDPIVDPLDPESVYVSLIPRESFSKVQLTMSSDLLLLKTHEHALLMEGDCDRYRIPAGAISVCEPQCFYHPIDHQHRNQL